jgi:hypothetical protein
LPSALNELPSALADGKQKIKTGFSRIQKLNLFLTALAKAIRMTDFFYHTRLKPFFFCD